MKDAHPTTRGFHGHSLANFAAAFVLSALTLATAWAGPEGGVIRRGEGEIVRPSAHRTDVRQHTQRMVVDWDSFDVAASEQVNFLQPSSDSAVLNRIFDQNPSQIFGQINANGRVLLSNANGIVFGESAAVNVGSLIASGLDVDADAFMSGQLSLHADSPGMIVNHGLINVAEGGHVGLIGGAVENSGVIIANFGSIELAAGRTATVDFDGDGLIQFAVSHDVLENNAGVDSAVNNTGTLQADGGMVAMSGHVANEIFSQVVNNEGVINARGVTTDGGRVFLSGGSGDTINTGDIDVSSDSGRGGRIELTGHRVGVGGNATLDASGEIGGGTVLVGGDYQGGGSTPTAEYTSVTSGVTIDVSAKGQGDGGTAIVWSDNTTRFHGNVTAQGGAVDGDGGFVEISGKRDLVFTGDVDTSAVHGTFGTLLLDPDDIQIIVGTAGSGADDGQVGDATINFGDGTGTFVITDGALNALNADIVLEANNSIVAAGGVSVTTGGGGGGRDLTMTTTTGDITLAGASFTASGGGTITLNAGGSIASGTLTAGGDVTLVAGSGIDVGGTVTSTNGDISLTTTTGNISGTGAVVVTNTSNQLIVSAAAGGATLNGANAFSVLDASVSSDSSITSSTAVDIANLSAGGNFALTAGGDVTQSAAVTVTGTLAVDAGSGDITLDDAANAYADISLAGNDATITRAAAVTFGDVTLAGDLTVDAQGSVVQTTGTSMVVGDLTDITTTGTIALFEDGNDFNRFAAVPGAIVLVIESNGIVLEDITASTVHVEAGGIVLAGTIDATGSTTFNLTGGTDLTTSGTGKVVGGGSLSLFAGAAGTEVSLTGNNTFSRLIASGTGAIDAITLNNTTGIIIGNGTPVMNIGTLTLTTAGDITEDFNNSGPTIGTAIFNPGAGNSVMFNTGFTDFGTVAMTGGANLTIVDANGVALGTASDAVNISGNLAVTANAGNITDSGQVLVGGNSTFTFNTASGQSLVLDSTNNNLAGSITLAGTYTSLNNLTIDDDSAVTLGALNLTGTLNLATGGSIGQTAAWLVNGAVTLDANGNSITLNNLSNNFNTLGFSGSTVSINNFGTGLTLSASDATTANISTFGGLGQTGALTIGNAIFNVGLGQGVALNGANDFDQLSIVAHTLLTTGDPAGNVSVNDTDGVQLNSILSNSGLTVTAGGNVTQGGSGISVAGTTFVNAAGSDVTLTNVANDFTTFRSNGNAVTVRDANGIMLGASAITDSFDITAGAAVGQSAAVTVTNAMTVDAGANNVTLTNAGNNFGALAVTGTNVSVRDQGNLDIGNGSAGINASGNLSLQLGGNLTQSNSINVGGITTLNVASASTDITLNDATNHFGNDVALSTTLGGSYGSVALSDDSALTISGVNASGNLLLNAQGAIGQSGAWIVAGNTSLTARNGGATFDIVANNLSNDFNAVAIDGANVSLRDTNGFSFAAGGSSSSGTLTVNSGGSVSDSGSLTIGGAALFNLTGATSDLVLDNDADFQGSLTVTGRNVVINDTSGALQIASINAGGAVTLDAVGNISTGSGIGAGTGQDIMLTSSGGAITVTAGGGITASGAGAITLDAQGGALTVNDTLGSGSGDVTLIGSSGVAFSVDGDITTQGDISVTATANGIGMADGTVFDATGGTGGITLTAANDVTLGRVLAAAGVVVTATGGQILDGTAAEGVGNENVVANTITLTAANGVGTSSDRLDTDALSAAFGMSLSANVTGTGDVYLNENGAANVGGTVNNGDFDYLSNGTIYIASIQADTTDDTVRLVTTGGNIDDMNDDIGPGGIDVRAANIVLNAGANNIGGNALEGAFNDPVGLIELDGNTTLTGHDINLGDVSTGTERVLNVTATGDFGYSFGNDIFIDQITAGGSVALVSLTGSIFDLQDDTTVDITVGAGETVSLRALGGAIGGQSQGNPTPGNGHIEIASGSISADADGGDILLHATGAATLVDIDASAGAIDITNGAGNLEIDTVNASGNVTLNAAGAIVDTNATASAVTGGTITLTAANGIGASGNEINTSAANLDLTTGAGGVFIDETDDVIIDGIDNSGSAIDIGTAGTISLGSDLTTANNALTLDGAVSLTGDVILSSGGGDISVTGTVTGGGNDFTVTSGAGGVGLASVTGVGVFQRNGSGNFTVSGDIDAGTVDINSGVQLGAGGDIAAAAGGIDISGGVSLAGAGAQSQLTTTADGNITVNGVINGSHGLVVSSQGNIALGTVSLAGSDASLTVDSDADAARTMTASSITARNVTLSGGGNNDVFDVGSVNASGDVALQTGGTIGGGTAIDAAGDISLNGNYQIGNLSLAGSDVSVTGNFDSTVGGGSLEIDNSGLLTLGANVMLNGTFEQSGGAVVLVGNIQTSADAITLGGELRLAGASHTVSSGGGAGNIAFSGGIDGNGADLAVNAGSGSVKLVGASDIGNLVLTGDDLALGATISVDTLDLSGVGGALSLVADTTIATDNTDVNLNGFASVDSAPAGEAGLVIDAGSGTVRLDGVKLGGTRRLASTDMTGAAIHLDNVATSGDQAYAGELHLNGTTDSASGDVRMNGDVSLDANARINAGGDVTIGGPIDGARSLVVAADGNVDVQGAIGAGSQLKDLTLKGAGIEVATVTTTGVQTYHGAARVGGNLVGESLVFNDSLFLPGAAVFVADTIDFNGGNGSVRGNGELSLVPATDGANIDIGGNGADLDLSSSALNGYDGGLVIGGTLTSTQANVVASTIAVNGDLDVGNGYLVLLSRENLSIGSAGQLSGQQLTLVAANDNGTITNDGGVNNLIVGERIVLVAGGTIGQDGADIQVRSSPGSRGTVQIASGATVASVNSNGTMEELSGTEAILAIAVADLLGLNTNTDLQVTSSAQSSANREQSGGLTDEGFIDASLFEEIALYETSGTGILLPLDQSEEMPETGCAVDEDDGTTRCMDGGNGGGFAMPAAPGAPR